MNDSQAPGSVSVALCTRNGTRFLPELLDSLAAQTLQPTEVVACDDASSDKTLTVLENFARRAPFSVHIHVHPTPLGVVGNFSYAIRTCIGQIIALADQDDIYSAVKLEKLSAALDARDAMAVFSDAEVVTADLSLHGYTMWQQVGFTAERRKLMQADRPWEVLFKDPVVTGATLMFKRELLPYILPIPDSWVHDAWIAQIAASQGRLVAIDEALLLYRQHAGNVIGGRKRTLIEQFRRANSLGRLGLVERELRRYTDLRDRLASFPATERRDIMLALAEAKLKHLEQRRKLPGNRLMRIPTVWQEWQAGNYRRFAKDWRNIAADLLMP